MRAYNMSLFHNTLRFHHIRCFICNHQGFFCHSPSTVLLDRQAKHPSVWTWENIPSEVSHHGVPTCLLCGRELWGRQGESQVKINHPSPTCKSNGLSPVAEQKRSKTHALTHSKDDSAWTMLPLRVLRCPSSSPIILIGLCSVSSQEVRRHYPATLHRAL